MSPSLKYYDSLDPEILAMLEISFEATCKELQRNPCLDQASLQTAIADLIITIASRGVSDPQKITALALAAFRSHLTRTELKTRNAVCIVPGTPG